MIFFLVDYFLFCFDRELGAQIFTQYFKIQLLKMRGRITTNNYEFAKHRILINMIEYKRQNGLYETLKGNNIIDELDINFALTQVDLTKQLRFQVSILQRQIRILHKLGVDQQDIQKLYNYFQKPQKNPEEKDLFDLKMVSNGQ